MTPTSTQRKLCRSLGPDYEIKLFDLEYVIYRDFHNGFDIEVSRTAGKGRCDVYLWFEERGPYLNYHDIPKDGLKEVLDFYEKLVEELVKRGFNNHSRLVALKERAQELYWPSGYKAPREARSRLKKMIHTNSEYAKELRGSYLELLWKTMEEMSDGRS